ncbi:hypothetical protein HMN09_00966500 [Mycena chlorophos]|uniref:Uncharacterized protein n=1 Tax=Mycena chlorophos TaxID=658473 RepID=A0A8H6W1K6_MYCCL|nr:hypothetical protein HMN09_00966500 [Mycena chlorophos]
MQTTTSMSGFFRLSAPSSLPLLLLLVFFCSLALVSEQAEARCLPCEAGRPPSINTASALSTPFRIQASHAAAALPEFADAPRVGNAKKPAPLRGPHGWLPDE